MGLKLVERARRDGALTNAGDFVANHVLRAEALLMQAGIGAAQFRKCGSGSVAVVASSLTGCPFRKFHPAEIRILRQNHRILPDDVCDPARARNAGRRSIQVAEPA